MSVVQSAAHLFELTLLGLSYIGHLGKALTQIRARTVEPRESPPSEWRSYGALEPSIKERQDS